MKKFVVYYTPKFCDGEFVQLYEGTEFTGGFKTNEVKAVAKMGVGATLNIEPVMVWRVA